MSTVCELCCEELLFVFDFYYMLVAVLHDYATCDQNDYDGVPFSWEFTGHFQFSESPERSVCR